MQHAEGPWEPCLAESMRKLFNSFKLRNTLDLFLAQKQLGTLLRTLIDMPSHIRP